MANRTLTPLICPSCQRADNKTSRTDEDRSPQRGDEPLLRGAQQWRCAQGHAFDIARHGYVNLLDGYRKHDGDTPDMLDARQRILSAGVFDPLDFTISTRCVPGLQPSGAHPGGQPPLTIIDAGAGTGHHSRAIIGHLESHLPGVELQLVAFDIASAAARRSSRLSHPTTITAVADVWDPWPLATSCADLVLSIFAPRNLRESARVLKPFGQLVVAIPDGQHLIELREITDALHVPLDKDDQITEAAGAWFSLEHRDHLRYTVALDHDLAADMVLMGPSAFHLSRDMVDAALERHSEPIDTTIDLIVLTFAPAS